jgi:hypothetical protein
VDHDQLTSEETKRRVNTMEDITAQARLLAVEVLLAEPELLGNDALEGDLYILRDKLKADVQAVPR